MKRLHFFPTDRTICDFFLSFISFHFKSRSYTTRGKIYVDISYGFIDCYTGTVLLERDLSSNIYGCLLNVHKIYAGVQPVCDQTSRRPYFCITFLSLHLKTFNICIRQWVNLLHLYSNNTTEN